MATDKTKTIRSKQETMTTDKWQKRSRCERAPALLKTWIASQAQADDERDAIAWVTSAIG